MQANKILIVRFSSIGDVLLVSPLLRALAKQAAHLQVQFVTKRAFAPLLENSPYLKKIHSFSKDFDECIEDLKAENFDLIIDLHNNLRSKRLSQALAVKTVRFNKINLRKLMAVYFKALGALPQQHIVERYFEPLKELSVLPDEKGLELFIAEKDRVSFDGLFTAPASKFIALVIGGSYETKQIPYSKLSACIQYANLPVVLMGGPDDTATAEKLRREFPKCYDAVGKLSLMQSASLISQAEWVITGDTGLMHMASAFDRKIISVWGNTIPEFGMSPYKPQPDNIVLEVKDLPCRPCSKLGYHSCPAGHFRCMNDIDLSSVKQLL